jgi:hypothetical protein
LNQTPLSVAFQLGKLKIKFVLASMKNLVLTKILPETLFRKLVSAFRPSPKILKMAPKAACDLENCSESRDLINGREGKPEWLSEQSLEMF